VSAGQTSSLAVLAVSSGVGRRHRWSSTGHQSSPVLPSVPPSSVAHVAPWPPEAQAWWSGRADAGSGSRVSSLHTVNSNIYNK
jgi:hypothetical protein